MHCREAADALDELADLEELQGEGFKARAYRRVARALSQLDLPLEEAMAQGAIEALPGVGEGILKKLAQLAETGSIAQLEKLRAQLPKGLLELLQVPGLGPKRAMALFKEQKIDSLAKLKEACEKGRLTLIKGFGPKSQQDILRGIQLLEQGGRRLLLPEAQRAAEEVHAALAPHAAALAWAGSLRRRRDTVGDLDFVGVARGRGDARGALAGALLGLPGAEALAQGERKTSVRLASGLQVDLRVVAEEEFGAALLYFTGSKAHNIRLRALASAKGWRLNEYGLHEAKDDGTVGRRLAGATEEGVYERLGLPPIPPELREDLGEVEAAQEGQLPRLLQAGELRGDLHNHTNRSDGMLSPEQWVKAAARAGLDYLGLTDHSIGLPAWGLTGAQLIAHRQEVLELADRHAGEVKVFVGVEANIGKDGELDLPANELDQLDYVVAGVHSHWNLPPEDMTRRVVKALEDGRIDILSHPTGRKLGQRAALDFDADRVFSAAADSGTALELDCQPDRLDLNGELARRAKEHGCRFAIDSDGHAAPHRDLLGWGVDQARRGWLGPGDVVNTRPADQVMAALKRRG